MVTSRIGRVAARVGLSVLVAVALFAGVPASSSARIGAPATLDVQAVPRIAGARIIVDGRTYLTNTRGFVAIASTSGVHHVTVLPPASAPRGTHLRFARWRDPLVLKQRTLLLRMGVNHEQVGFIVSHPVSVTVKGPSGQMVPFSRISSIMLSSSLGQRFTFVPRRPLAHLAMNHIVRKGSGLVSLPVRYAMQAVMMDGANVVHLGGQRFFVRPSTATRWTVQALVFPMRVQVHDALFGFAIGQAVRLTLPDGSTRIVDLGAGHTATLVGLPRGLYGLVPKGPGIGLSSPTALSRPQGARLLLLSWLDIGVVLAFAVVFLVGLPLVGGRIVRRAGRRVPAWRSSREDALRAMAGVDATDLSSHVMTAATAPGMNGKRKA